MKALKKHPPELWILGLTELCERFAFWGIGYLLVLYLIEYYHYQNENATHIYGIFSGFAAFLPLVGGWIADRWNYQSPLFLGAIVNALGCFLLATGVEHLLYVALIIVACGYGIFTPSILTVLSYTYRDKPELREAGFSIYYASINVGVFLALASLGTIAKLVNWDTAFIVAGFVQLAGLIPLTIYLVKHKETYRALKTMQKESHATTHRLSPTEKSRLLVIVAFYLVSILFWASYNQGFSSMAIFAHDFMNKRLGGVAIPEGIFLSSESFFLIVLAPILAYLYAKLQKKGKDPSPATKTAFSLLAIAACFFVMMLGSAAIPASAKSADVSWTFLIGAYFLMAVGEMLLAPIGLSHVSRLSPPRYTALMIGLWYACVGIAFYNGGLLAGLMNKMGGLFNFFSLFVAMTLIPAFILFFFSKKLTKMSHLNSHSSQGLPHVER
jgi:POT family proton-dependent oligopeptide transporter